MSSSASATHFARGTLWRLIGRFRAVPGPASGILFLALINSAAEVAHPLLLAYAIGRLAGDDAAQVDWLPADFHDLLWLFAGVLALKKVLFYTTRVWAARVGQDLENGLRRELFHQVMALRFRYHDKNRSGHTIARSLRDMEKARHFFREVWFGYLEMIVLLGAMLAAIYSTHWSYGVVVTVAFTTGIVLCAVTGIRVARIDRTVSDDYDQVSTVVQENVAGARVVRAFGQEGGERQKFGRRIDTFSHGWRGLERYWAGRMPFVMNAYHAATPLVLLLGAWRINQGVGSLTETTAVLLFGRHVLHRMRPLMRLLIVGQQAVASASRVFEVLDDTDRLPAPSTPTPLPAEGGHLHLEDVAFTYPESEEILSGIDLEIPAGGSLGLIGPTGAGKSTLVQLLPRFYDADRGAIRLDGVPVEALDPDVLRRAIGIVFQEPFLFSGTVLDNVRYGNPDASEAQVWRALRLAAAEEFVRALPEGIQTVIGERGVSLSGGQRQRLTIARAVAMDPRVLVFDDATASVDAVTEKQLFEGIRAAASGCTTLVISQRVTSVRWCDRIAVQEDGRITAIGTHTELLSSSALYAEIHAHQQLSAGRRAS